MAIRTLAQFLSSSPKTAALAVLPILLVLYNVSRKPKRPTKVSKSSERVLILGASSGVGKAIARKYAARGARVCVVGRRQSLLDDVKKECKDVYPTTDSHVLSIPADFTNVDGMTNVRSQLEAGVYTFSEYRRVQSNMFA